jgi:hypothetical protein
MRRIVVAAGLALWAAVAHAQAPYPSNFNREWRCPNIIVDRIPPGYHESVSDLNSVSVDQSLTDMVPELSLVNNTALILIKRVYNSTTGLVTPYFRYLGNGHENFAIETWSSSKIFSAMNGAGHLNEQCGGSCGGLPRATTGDYGVTPLGDLVTVIVTYDTTHPPYSSNALGGWFEMLGGRERAVRLIQQWMNRTGESIGANYGATPPADLKFTFQPDNCTITPDSPDNGNNANTLSALTAAELVKRIVFARELPNETFPGTSWLDSQVLLYGAEKSALFPGRQWGGMSANADEALRWGLNMTEIQTRSHGNFRTFSKDGEGYSSIRDAGEALINGYACYPDLDHPENGVEYIVSARVSVPLDTQLAQASKDFLAALTALNQAIFAHRLD